MGFFGEVIDENGVEIPIPEGYHLRLLQVCFNPTPEVETNTKSKGKQGKTSPAPLTLTVSTGDDGSRFVLCVVNPSIGHFQAQSGHTFGPEDGPIVFQVTGGELHVTGEWIWEEEGCEHMEAEDDEEEEEQEESEEESGDDELPNLVPVEEIKTADKKKDTDKKKRSNSDVDSNPQPSGNTSKKVKADKIESAKSVTDDVSGGAEAPKSLKKWKVHLEGDEGVVVPDVKSVVKSGGVVVTDFIMGKGQEPKPGASVKVLYEGYFPDGTLFDAKQKKKQPFVFRKGTGQVIKGMDVGLEGMRIGGAREVFIPYAMGYGLKGAGDDIPPKQDLVFRLRLIG